MQSRPKWRWGIEEQRYQRAVTEARYKPNKVMLLVMPCWKCPACMSTIALWEVCVIGSVYHAVNALTGWRCVVTSIFHRLGWLVPLFWEWNILSSKACRCVIAALVVVCTYHCFINFLKSHSEVVKLKSHPSKTWPFVWFVPLRFLHFAYFLNVLTFLILVLCVQGLLILLA